MKKYITYILILYIFCCYARSFDILRISDHKTVVKLISKRNALENTDDQIVKKQLNLTVNSSVTRKETQIDESQTKEKNKTNADDTIINAEHSNSTNINNNFIISNRRGRTSDHPGALLRGFYVFLGLSILIIMYFIFRAFSLRPGAPPSATVRKYGVIGRRNDLEMLPLPLTEEDDDDTVFDMGAHTHR